MCYHVGFRSRKIQIPQQQVGQRTSYRHKSAKFPRICWAPPMTMRLGGTPAAWTWQSFVDKSHRQAKKSTKITSFFRVVKCHQNMVDLHWWTKSCTTKDDDYPIIYRVLTCFNHPRWCRILSINSMFGFLGVYLNHDSFAQNSKCFRIISNNLLLNSLKQVRRDSSWRRKSKRKTTTEPGNQPENKKKTCQKKSISIGTHFCLLERAQHSHHHMSCGWFFPVVTFRPTNKIPPLPPAASTHPLNVPPIQSSQVRWVEGRTDPETPERLVEQHTLDLPTHVLVAPLHGGD